MKKLEKYLSVEKHDPKNVSTFQISLEILFLKGESPYENPRKYARPMIAKSSYTTTIFQNSRI